MGARGTLRPFATLWRQGRGVIWRIATAATTTPARWNQANLSPGSRMGGVAVFTCLDVAPGRADMHFS